MSVDTHEASRYKEPAFRTHPPHCEAGKASKTMSFGTLLYRYFFFGWLFKDVNQGNLLERSAAWRHNQAQARWLPTYMRRWVWCGALLYGLGGLAEWLLNAPGVSVLFYVPSALSVPVNAVLGAAWVGLKVLPAQI